MIIRSLSNRLITGVDAFRYSSGPNAKDVSFTIALPVMKTAEDIDNALGIVIAEVAAGNITADEADALGRLLVTKRKAIETVDLERRVAAMEARRA